MNKLKDIYIVDTTINEPSNIHRGVLIDSFIYFQLKIDKKNNLVYEKKGYISKGNQKIYYVGQTNLSYEGINEIGELLIKDGKYNKLFLSNINLFGYNFASSIVNDKEYFFKKYPSSSFDYNLNSNEDSKIFFQKSIEKIISSISLIKEIDEVCQKVKIGKFIYNSDGHFIKINHGSGNRGKSNFNQFFSNQQLNDEFEKDQQVLSLSDEERDYKEFENNFKVDSLIFNNWNSIHYSKQNKKSIKLPTSTSSSSSSNFLNDLNNENLEKYSNLIKHVNNNFKKSSSNLSNQFLDFNVHI